MEKRILAIVRASSESQEIESQRVELFQYLNSFGYSDEEIELIAVAGASARKKNKKYLQMLDDVKQTIISNPSIKAVGLWGLNRLGRVDDSLILMKNWFIEHGIDVICKNPSFKLFNSDGTVNGGAELAFGVYAAMIKQESDELINKMTRGKRHNTALGKFNGGRDIKFGYAVGEGGYLIPNEEEADFIRQIFALYATGKYSMITLSRELNSRGQKQRNKAITDRFVAHILSDKTYIGENPEKHYVPLVDKALFKKVELVRKNNKQNQSKETKYSNFAIKILKCKICGSNYCSSNNHYRCYKEAKGYRFGDDRCYGPSILMDVIDELLWSIAKMNHIDYLEQLDKDSIGELKDRNKVLKLKIREVERQIEKLGNAESRIKKLFILGDLSDSDYEKEKKEVNDKISNYNVILEQHKKESGDIERTIKEIESPDLTESLSKLSAMMYDVASCHDYKKQSEIIHQHIKVAYIERIGDSMKIEITDVIGETYYFTYYPELKRTKKRGWLIDNNGRKPITLK